MNVDYWPVGTSAPSVWPVTKVELATDIALDWMPTRPASSASGVVDLLAEVIQEENVDGVDYWLAHPAVAGFERQWRGVTSFMMGVPFCIKVLRAMGYTWWAPVSCFRHNLATNKPFYWWSPFFPLSQCQVEHVSPPLSPLYPDYIAARADPAGGYRIAFFEAKGTTRALHAAPCPINWHNQARSAELKHRGNTIATSQHVVVATRLDPDRVRSRTRKIQVRAWNNHDPELKAPFDVIAEVVRLHYLGVCLRLGMKRTARALALAPLRWGDDAEHSRLSEALWDPSASFEETGEAFKEETVETPFRNSRDERIHYPRRRGACGSGPFAVRPGLASPAVWLIQFLIDGKTEAAANMIRDLPHKLAFLAEATNSDEHCYLRPDGVYSELGD